MAFFFGGGGESQLRGGLGSSCKEEERCLFGGLSTERMVPRGLEFPPDPSPCGGLKDGKNFFQEPATFTGLSEPDRSEGRGGQKIRGYFF